MNYEESMQALLNLKYIINSNYLNDEYTPFNQKDLEAIDNGISALKTLADMPQKWQFILTCTDAEMEQLMKLHLNSIYGQNVSHETFTKGETNA